MPAYDGNQAFDLTRAPFRLNADAEPFQVAEEMAACFEVVAGMPAKMTRCVNAAMFSIGLADDAPLARAGATLAAEIDAGVGDGRANPYHNSQHFCEALLSVLYLSALASMPLLVRARMVSAALAHDFHHDGRNSIGAPFRLERLAAQASLPYFDEAGVAADEQSCIATLILATETTVGVPFARKGEFVATATGVEGSLVYAASSLLRDDIIRTGSATFHLDLLPDMPPERVLAEVQHPRGTRSLSSHLKSRLHIDGIKAGILYECLSKEVMADPVQLAAAIKALPITLTATRPIDEAISTAGGVLFEAMTPDLMLESLPGVFCAGEMLDWEAPTGGYLLQACFASGRRAGQGVRQFLQDK